MLFQNLCVTGILFTNINSVLSSLFLGTCCDCGIEAGQRSKHVHFVGSVRSALLSRHLSSDCEKVVHCSSWCCPTLFFVKLLTGTPMLQHHPPIPTDLGMETLKLVLFSGFLLSVHTCIDHRFNSAFAACVLKLQVTYQILAS